MKFTPQLRALLNDYRSALSPQEIESLELEVLRLFKHYYNLIAKAEPGVVRGKLLHDLIEEQNASSSEIKTSCQKGCGACCHLEVEITSDDAAVLADSLFASKTLQIDYDHLEQLALRRRLDEQWKKGPVPSNRCVFLGPNNACQNYQNRPSVCRKHSVISPREECEKLNGTVVPRLVPLNEIILSAAISQPGSDFGALPKMLHRALKMREEKIKHPSLEEC